ncbi:MAG: glucose-6-phosphate isomerase, partial [Bacteroidota bacterium]
MRLSLDRSRALPFLTDRDALDGDVMAAHQRVLTGETQSPEMLGWRRMLLDPDDALIESVQGVADEVRERADVLVCVGIGGSYLGAEAVNQALAPYFGGDGPEVIFAGHHLSPAYHEQLLAHLDGKSV